ncbi:hypothetical protein FIV42_24465 [Persicimonas caeni]|uniref:Uncharacterized protein n=1 Tax=Persicimonas caeni TaxID=2292766 RepID=A0A4Y6PZV8_PERCE|nr:hypothetical protein [Persicimonas caeni]QDG53780.1 hypothetical protein FIV42_24465 [Persicimonas caeni]QED35001.1 hypothetical protein FRD00_24460 [Persicimonas caeni]
MSRDNTTAKDGWSRQEWLALVLGVVMVGLMGRMAYKLYLEGDEICSALQKSLESAPGRRMPCTRLSYYAEPVDWLALVGSDGAIPAPVSADYSFDNHGSLVRVETDHGDDGDVDIVYECTLLGKMLMPFTNYDAWTSYGAITELSKGSQPADEAQLASEGETGVGGLHTELRVRRQEPFWVQYEAKTHANGGELVRRVVHGEVTRTLTDTSYEYDGGGDLISMRTVRVSHPNTFVRQTDYTYECWD